MLFSLYRRTILSEEPESDIERTNAMFTYKSEILPVSTKWLSDKANEEDAAALDELLNRRSAEGWELVTYDYMATSVQVRGAFILTFRKEA